MSELLARTLSDVMKDATKDLTNDAKKDAKKGILQVQKQWTNVDEESPPHEN